MAQFSKQWCEINDPQKPYDFDIYEVFNKLKKEELVIMICEGFGFVAMARDLNDTLLLAVPESEGLFKWVTLDKLVEIGE